MKDFKGKRVKCKETEIGKIYYCCILSTNTKREYIAKKILDDLFETQMTIISGDPVWNYQWTWISNSNDVFIELSPKDYPEYYV
jgi:hypothetical protein